MAGVTLDAPVARCGKRRFKSTPVPSPSNRPMSFNRIFTAVAAALILGAMALGASLQNSTGAKQESRPAADAKSAVTVAFFGNEKCPFTGKAVDRSKAVAVKGGFVYVCCDRCLTKAKDDKDLESKAYPADKNRVLNNEICPLMNEKVGDSKDKITLMGRVLSLCCEGCGDEALASPVATLMRVENPKATYVGNATCPVSDHKVSGRDVAMVDNKIINLCCNECVDALKKDAAKVVAAAEESVKKAREKKKEKAGEKK